MGGALGHPPGAGRSRAGLAGAYLGNLPRFEVLAVSQWLVLHRESRERAVRASKLEAELARAQLQLLRLQLDPHFLFNTLHAIGTLVHAEPEAAERMIVLLSDLLRRALQEMGGQEVALREEVEFLDRYLEIEHVRFPDRLRVVREIQPESLGALVPTLLLHPLVENAIRHGVSRRAQGGCLGIRARRGRTAGAPRGTMTAGGRGPRMRAPASASPSRGPVSSICTAPRNGSSCDGRARAGWRCR